MSSSVVIRRVADSMRRGLVSCPPHANLKTVAELMTAHGVHSVVVADDPSSALWLWGVISDLDLIAAASVRRLEDQEAGATAMTPALTIEPGEPLEHAVDLMTRYAVAHLIVVDPVLDRPVGVLSTLDVAAALAAA